MHHDEKVAWRSELYDLYKRHDMSLEDIGTFGDPWISAGAEEILLGARKERGTLRPIPHIELSWAGGGESGCTFDVTFLVPSKSGECGFYLLDYKLGRCSDFSPRAPENLLRVLSPPSHQCEYTAYERKIGRLPGPCVHEIAGKNALRIFLPTISKMYFELLGESEAFRLEQDVPENKSAFLHRHPADVMNFYWYLENDFRPDNGGSGVYDSILKRDLFYTFLENREHPSRGDSPEYRKWYGTGENTFDYFLSTRPLLLQRCTEELSRLKCLQPSRALS